MKINIDALEEALERLDMPTVNINQVAETLELGDRNGYFNKYETDILSNIKDFDEEWDLSFQQTMTTIEESYKLMLDLYD